MYLKRCDIVSHNSKSVACVLHYCAFLPMLLSFYRLRLIKYYLTLPYLTKPYMVIYRIICVTSSVSTTPSDVASDRATIVSRDYAQSRQILLNMDTCVIVLPHPLYGTRYQRTFDQLSHLLLVIKNIPF